MHHISLNKLNSFKSIILVLPVIRPTTSIGTHHIGSVSDRPKNKRIIFIDNGFQMAEANSQPTSFELFDLITKCFGGVDWWFHDGKLVALNVD